MNPPTTHLPAAASVVGAGTMGAGIALAFALAGCQNVRLMARHESTLDRATDRIARSLSLLETQGIASHDQTRAAKGCIGMTTSLEVAVTGCDLVIESITEDLAAKRTLLHEIHRYLAPTAVLSTNTSSLSIDELSDGLPRPEKFAGFHWLNPPELVPVVEIVAGSQTSASTVSQLLAWAHEAGKVPIHILKDVPGFLVNRLQYALLREAFSIVESGVCSYSDVDLAVRMGLGPRWSGVGPFETMDLAGLDIHHAVATRLYPLLSNLTGVPGAVTELVERGALGAKSGEGLRGAYSDNHLRTVTERRDKVLLAMAKLAKAGESVN